ncbi:MAG: ABC transporter substrate-binding protein [Hyphomonadaceae bacterium]|nr:ABC transporter substrate-binding protein [Hyphomonadaceae bacterium]
MLYRRKLPLALATIAIASISTTPLAAQDDAGVTDKDVLICSYQPMTGSVSSYFRMGKGADAWIKHVNEQGGINGRTIEFKMADDKYEPPRTADIVKRFVERNKCFAIVAPLGSAPTSAVIDYIVENKVPLIGAGTGADKNVYYKSRYVFPLYAPYDLEGTELVRFAKEVLKAKKIAVLYQNDPSGKSHMLGIEVGLKKFGVEMTVAEGYQPKELDVSSQVIKMKDSGADAVICSCAPEPAAKFYTERQKLGWKAPVVNVFFGKSPKVPELAGKEAVEGVYFATIYREWDDPAPQIQQAKALLKKYYPEEEPDAVHLWGFTGVQVFTEALKRMGKGPITRERLIETLEGIKNWKDSVVPNVNIEKMGPDDTAIKHLLVPGMSYVVYKGGNFQGFKAPWNE